MSRQKYKARRVFLFKTFSMPRSLRFEIKGHDQEFQIRLRGKNIPQF